MMGQESNSGTRASRALEVRKRYRLYRQNVRILVNKIDEEDKNMAESARRLLSVGAAQSEEE